MRTGDVPVQVAFLSDAQVALRLARRQAAFDRQERTDWRETAEHLLWSIGSERYAIPLGDVRAVVPLPRVTRVPGGPPKLIGLVSLRGVIHNLFDPATALGSTSGEGGGRAIVLRHDRPALALRVSGTEGIVSLPAEEAKVDGLTRFVAAADGGFGLVSTARLIEQLLARRGPREG